ncbi:MAG: type II toxin-antitoxin system prevent-host-death family antitoxin [Micrococcales bacterium]|nr:type II toxin-antitoxin system prevent-host-death family antitoxin [Micrococcales bacterium]
MRSISIAELRQNPAPALDTVARGQALTVTRYRRPVARIVPVTRQHVRGTDVMQALASTPVDDQWALQLEAERSMDRAADPWKH